jgi:hypothetical protein
MGAYISKEDFELIDSSYYHFPYSKDLKMSCWETYNAKNWNYYNGNRFFKVSRKNYRDYKRGYIYGYYYNGDGYVSDDEIEHAF